MKKIRFIAKKFLEEDDWIFYFFIEIDFLWVQKCQKYKLKFQRQVAEKGG